MPTTPIRKPGARSASADRQGRAATCGCISTGAIRGRRSRRRTAGLPKRCGRTVVSDEAMHEPRALRGRAPDVFRVGGWVPMREYREDEAVDFVIVGTGAGGGTLACKLAEAGFSVVALDAGPYWRPLEDFASDEHHQA